MSGFPYLISLTTQRRDRQGQWWVEMSKSKSRSGSVQGTAQFISSNNGGSPYSPTWIPSSSYRGQKRSPNSCHHYTQSEIAWSTHNLSYSNSLCWKCMILARTYEKQGGPMQTDRMKSLVIKRVLEFSKRQMGCFWQWAGPQQSAWS